MRWPGSSQPLGMGWPSTTSGFPQHEPAQDGKFTGCKTMHLDLTRRWLLSKTSAYVPHPKARRLARALHTNRHALAARLAENVRSWEKYESEFQKHAANPGAFVKLEFYVFIDYLDRYFSTGDDTYKILYISEK